MVYFTHKRLEGGRTHEHIVRLWWRNAINGNTGQMSRQDAVDWVAAGNKAYVTDGSNTIEVQVVRPSGAKPYLRTVKDGKYTDNLLALPDN